MSPFYGTRVNFTLPEIRVPELHDSCYSVVYLCLILRNCFRKPRKDVQVER